MSTRGNGKRIGLLLLLLFALAGCGVQEDTAVMAESKMLSEEENEFLFVTENDLKMEAVAPEYVNLSEAEEDFMIVSGGEYVLSGAYHQTIIIDTHDEIVHLFFDNVNIETAMGPAIYAKSAGKVIITLLEGSMNTLLDGAVYKNEDVNAAISAECDLTVNGNGTLYVCGYYKDAIHTKDVFKLLSGTVQLKSKRYGIKGNDGMVLAPDSLLIESEGSGCCTSKADKEGKGIIDIRGGEISVVAGEYALSSAGDIYVRDGMVYLNSVISDIYTEGKQLIAEGTIIDE